MTEKKLTNAEIADLIYGLDPAEQAQLAKEFGLVPDETGLIEFDKPIGHEDVDGELVPVTGLVCVEDVQPLTDEELEKLEAEEAAAEQETPVVGLASSTARRPSYRWRLSGGGWRNFHGFGTHRVSTPAGVLGIGINAVFLDAHGNGVPPWAAGTRYYTHRLDRGTGNTVHWSPNRWSTTSNRILYFNSTVYGERCHIFRR